MKKSLYLLLGLFIIFSFNCYAGETLTAQQKEAREWVKKGLNALTFGDSSAFEYYTNAIELDPKLADAYLGRGIAFFQFHLYYGAIDDYTKAIELDPKLADAYYNRGLAYYAMQVFPAVACDDFYQAGLLYLKQNNRTEALQCIDLMKKADPSSPLIKKLMDKIYAEPKKKNNERRPPWVNLL